MTKKRVIALQTARKPTSSSDILTWIPGGPAEVSATSRTHIVGTYTSSNGYSAGENINPGGSGNIYTSSEGFSSNVQTKTNTQFYSLHFIGNNSGLTSGSNITGSSFLGKTASTSISGNWTKTVVGFYCQISRKPSGSGDSADGCGRTKTFRICAVYLDTNRQIRIMDMCEGGSKILGHTWNTEPSGTGWYDMAYFVNDRTSVISGGWRHLGWIINFTHYKNCGGNQQQKNCTGRVRYLTPLVSNTSDGGLFTGPTALHTVVPARNSWSVHTGLASNKYSILTV